MLLAIAALGAVALGVAIASPGGSRRGPASRAGGGGKALPPLKHHPQVVIAEAPGDIPPDAQFTYGEEPEAATFQPPSDAEVERELHQLHVAKLGGDGAYVDPFSQVRGLEPERIDMGVDYAGAGPVLALGSGTVFNTKGSGWPGGVFIGITLDDGPFAGFSYFVAEDVKPAVRVGDHVRAGQEIAAMYRGPAGIETGWASGRGQTPLAAALGQQNKRGDPGGWTSAAGISFDRVLVSTGTPSGIPQGTKVHGKMPASYP
jgi:murein DD-endopeptidase MepM/ murein hydrolase activator NlpD